jgi:hypothetical protein
MNVYAVTYTFNGEDRVILHETEASTTFDVKAELHPAIVAKNPYIDYVGTLA